MAHVSHKLKNSFQGALAGGGDPATSPLYVFGPFLKLIVAAGVAQVTFGGSVWIAILTIAVVSAMYRLVMKWVTDGSGGSGLSEEEFGGWAVKVNAAITFVEYTLTFLVSMAAMVTFLADRIPVLNNRFLFIQYRTIVAIVLSLLTGWLVNRGPKMATFTFGPATAGVLLLLWTMVIATIIKTGIHLPKLNLSAFSPTYFHFTMAGYVRILAVMTGIEVFANLVAAYDGEPAEKSRKAFQSLLIIMGTTGVTMLIVGPAIFNYSDPTNPEVSVFTQTMDVLLPQPLPYIGTLIGIAVLMSASAASAQGLQNLALGLKERHYIPPILGERNQFDVADKPVWVEVAIVSLCFLLFGTHEETYLALYAAGVFILLSMTGWAVTKRLLRELRQGFTSKKAFTLGGVIIAALLTSSATIIIFEERFLEGAWAYFLFIPILYGFFSYFRKRIGDPTPEMDYLGQLDAALLAGFGFGQSTYTQGKKENGGQAGQLIWQPEDSFLHTRWLQKRIEIHRVAVLLDGSDYAAQAIPVCKTVCSATGAHLSLLSSCKCADDDVDRLEFNELQTHLTRVAEELLPYGIQVSVEIREGSTIDITDAYVKEKNIDMIITTTRGKSGEKNWLTGGLSSKLVHKLDIPILLVQTVENGSEQPLPTPKFQHILVALDGSVFSEQALPFARALGKAFHSHLTLLSVPAVPESINYRAPAEIINTIRGKAVTNMQKFVNTIASSLRNDDLNVQTLVTGSMPARTIVETADQRNADLIMITSQGRGGLDLFFMGSVAQLVVQNSEKPVLIVPINKEIDVLPVITSPVEVLPPAQPANGKKKNGTKPSDESRDQNPEHHLQQK